jgi:hypothetical protein
VQLTSSDLLRARQLDARITSTDLEYGYTMKVIAALPGLYFTFVGRTTGRKESGT